MRVFVAVQPTPRTGASSLSRYIAQSKVDRDREQVDEKGSRPLFSEREDSLTYSEADRILNPTSGELEKEDVIHVVISPERGSFDRAGDTDDERKQTFREAIRDAIQKMARELKVRFLNWIGGLHGNTRTPHGHLAVSRWAIDEKTGKLVYIKHLPESLLPRNVEGEDGTKRFSTGKIAEFFERAFNLKRQPVRFVQLQHLAGGIEISRSVLSPYAVQLYEPTPQERLVGRWIGAELTLARAIGEVGDQAELTRECFELRGLVAELDAGARAQGARPTAGYVELERLEELIRANSSALSVKVFAERPQGQEEKYVERSIGQPGTGADEQTPAVPLSLDQAETKVSPAPLPLISPGSPANAAQRKFNSPHHAEGARQGRAPSVRLWTPRDGAARGAKDVAAPIKVEPKPRLATTTLEELRGRIVQSRNDDAASRASEARQAVKVHEGGIQQIVTKEGALSVEPLALAKPISSARTAHAPEAVNNSGAPLPAAQGAPNESRISDAEIGQLAHSMNFNGRYMERGRDVLAADLRKEVEQVHLSGNANDATIAALLEPLHSFELKLCEANQLDQIYENVRRKLNIPKQRFSDSQENFLKELNPELIPKVEHWLLGEMVDAKKHLLSVAPFANPILVKVYDRFQEEERARAAIVRDREKQAIASRDGERSMTATLEHDAHSTLIAPLPGKEAAPSRELVEKVIELIL